MSPTSAAAKGKRRSPARKRKKKGALLIWWPVLLGVAVTPFAIHFASILALEGPSALRLLYPYVVLVKDPAFGLSSDLGNELSQGMMYAQFPLYGLLMALAIRWKGVGPAFAAAVLIHGAGVLALFFLAHMRAH
jgi:hypothetical protein